MRIILSNFLSSWFRDMSQSQDKSIVIDIASVFEDMLMKNVTMNVFGKDNSDTPIDDFEIVDDEGIRTETVSLGKSIF